MQRWSKRNKAQLLKIKSWMDTHPASFEKTTLVFSCDLLRELVTWITRQQHVVSSIYREQSGDRQHTASSNMANGLRNPAVSLIEAIFPKSGMERDRAWQRVGGQGYKPSAGMSGLLRLGEKRSREVWKDEKCVEKRSSGIFPCGHCKSVNRPDTWEPHKWLIWAESLAGQALLGHRHRDALFSPESIARARSRQPDKEHHRSADSPLIYRCFDLDWHWINRPLFNALLQ